MPGTFVSVYTNYLKTVVEFSCPQLSGFFFKGVVIGLQVSKYKESASVFHEEYTFPGDQNFNSYFL